MSLKNQILALHKAGYKSNEITAALNISHATHRSALHSAGLPLPPLPQGAREEIHNADHDIEDAHKIAKQYLTSMPLVQQCIRRQPEALNDRRPPLDELRLMDSTMTAEEIATHLDISLHRVNYWLANMPGHTQRLSDADIADINVRLARGERQTAIAQIYDVTSARICQLSKYSRSQTRATNIPWEDILEQHNQGVLVAHLAKKYKVSKAAIYAQLRNSYNSY